MGVEHSEERRERREREMSAIFDGYEREYCELSTQLARKTNMLGSLSGDSKSQKSRDITNDLSEAEALIRRMDLEARSLPPDKKSPLLSKLREYKADLSKLKSDAKKGNIYMRMRCACDAHAHANGCPICNPRLVLVVF